jgi:hypothetical protein
MERNGKSNENLIFLDCDFKIPMSEPHADSLDSMAGAIAILTATLAFLIHRFHGSLISAGPGKDSKYTRDTASARSILSGRLSGFGLYGMIPFLILVLVFRRPLADYGFMPESLWKVFLWWIVAAVAIFPPVYVFARNERNLAMYPEIRATEWDRNLVLQSAFTWMVYLVGYEFLLRGFLLFTCLESFGYWPAILINISLYSLFHLHKGSREAFGSLVFGFFLCFITLRLGTFWFSVFVHVTLALSNEWLSVKFHPEMKFMKKTDRT